MLPKFAAMLAILFAMTLQATPASAGEGDAVCILHSTLIRTSPKKVPTILTVLDCGTKATEAQKALAAEINNAQNVADSLNLAAKAGYEVTGVSVRESYTGHEVFGVYTLVKEGCCGGCGMEDAAEPKEVNDPDGDEHDPDGDGDEHVKPGEDL